MKGYKDQNLGRNLPLNESRMTATQFDDFLMKSHELDPENFQLGNVMIAGDDGPVSWPVIIGEHPLKRMDERTFMVAADIMRKTNPGQPLCCPDRHYQPRNLGRRRQ